jgi:hypothetical protein
VKLNPTAGLLSVQLIAGSACAAAGARTTVSAAIVTTTAARRIDADIPPPRITVAWCALEADHRWRRQAALQIRSGIWSHGLLPLARKVGSATVGSSAYRLVIGEGYREEAEGSHRT